MLKRLEYWTSTLICQTNRRLLKKKRTKIFSILISSPIIWQLQCVVKKGRLPCFLYFAFQLNRKYDLIFFLLCSYYYANERFFFFNKNKEDQTMNNTNISDIDCVHELHSFLFLSLRF